MVSAIKDSKLTNESCCRAESNHHECSHHAFQSLPTPAHAKSQRKTVNQSCDKSICLHHHVKHVCTEHDTIFNCVQHLQSNQPKYHGTSCQHAYPHSGQKNETQNLSSSPQRPCCTARANHRVRTTTALVTPPASPLSPTESRSSNLEMGRQMNNLWDDTYRYFDYWIFYRIEALKMRLEDIDARRRQLQANSRCALHNSIHFRQSRERAGYRRKSSRISS